MKHEAELLRTFAEEGSQEAFAELVRLKVDLVFAAALRQTGGDAALAQDVTQQVFLVLARDAGRLRGHTALTGWLFTTTRHLAIGAMRQQRRWQRREQEATTMKTLTMDADQPKWEELRPVIDEVLHELGEKDRTALVLRFFEGQSLAEVGEVVGLAENSARMRVERALEKLRARLARRGITSTAVALGAVLGSQPVVAAPAGLAASAVAMGLAGAAVGGAGATAGLAATMAFMSTTKLVGLAAALVAVGALGGYLGARQTNANDVVAATRAVGGATAGEGRGEADGPRGAGAVGVAVAGRKPGGGGVVGAESSTAAGSRGTQALESLRVLMDLRRRNLAAADVPLVAEGAKVTDQFAELFALTAGERAAMQRGLDAARVRVTELERENSSVTRGANGEVTYTLKAFPEAGGAAYDALMKTFSDTLGAERYNAFLTLGGEQAEKELDHFGTSRRAATIMRQTTAEGEVRYRIRSQESRTPEDNSNYLSDWMSYDKLVKEAGVIVSLLPPDFGPPR